MKHILASLTIVLALFSGNAIAQGNAEDSKIMGKLNTGTYDGPTYPSTEIKALFVIQDGLDFYEIQDDSYKDINPSWIERIDVLKGENATEMFSERGGNGVVIITLKEDDKAAQKYFRKIKKSSLLLTK